MRNIPHHRKCHPGHHGLGGGGSISESMALRIPAPVADTFEVLRTSETENLSAVLMAALDVPREPIQYAAAELLLDRPSVTAQVGLLHRLPVLPASVRELVAARSAALDATFRHTLLNGSSESRCQSLAAIRFAGLTAPLAHVLELLQRPDCPEQQLAAETLRAVVDQQFDRGQQSETRASSRKQRDEVLDLLDKAAVRGAHAVLPEEIVQSVLVLGDPNHRVVKRVVWHGSPATRELSHRLLLESRHPGVLRFLSASLSEYYPHPQVFVALRERTDPEFISALLRLAAVRLSAVQQRNLEQVDDLPWLSPPLKLLATIPPAWQPALPQFLRHTRLARAQKAAVLEWLMRHGTPAARLAASEGLSLLDDDSVQDVVRENLDAENPELQAWATSQLRHCALPEAFTLLVDRLESPHAEVRAAARGELASFNVERVLSQVDEWSADEAQRAGRLLLLIDPESPAKLRHELLHPARQKRTRTIRAVLQLDLQQHVADTLLSLALDTDAQVRRAVVEALEQLRTRSAMESLMELLDDEHPRVREAAAAALGRLRNPETVESMNTV